MATKTDLAIKLKEGDQKALKTFFESFYPSACSFAIHFITQNDVAEDLVQNAFLEYWNRRSHFENLDAIRSFIYTSVRNSCLNHLKQKRFRESVHENEFAQEKASYELVIEEETYRLLYEYINKLPERTRQIIKLSLEGAKNNEIADSLGVSVNTVKTLKKNGYRELRENLKDQQFLLFIVSMKSDFFR